LGRLIAAVEASTTHNGPTCSIAVVQKRLSPEDLADLDYLLRDERYPATVIAHQLGVITGTEVASKSLNYHRRTLLGKGAGCKCPV
jgi:hypothetical protein